jgi:hypothetical protein
MLLQMFFSKNLLDGGLSTPLLAGNLIADLQLEAFILAPAAVNVMIRG